MNALGNFWSAVGRAFSNAEDAISTAEDMSSTFEVIHYNREIPSKLWRKTMITVVGN